MGRRNRIWLACVALGAVVMLVAAGISLAGEHGGPQEPGSAQDVVSGHVSCPSGTTGAGSYTITQLANGTFFNGWLSITNVDAGRTRFDWALVGQGLDAVEVAAVVVQGGPDSAVYSYEGAVSGSGLTAPSNAQGQPYPIDRVVFCFDPKGDIPLAYLKVRKVVVGAQTPASDFSFVVNGTLYAFETDGENTVVLPEGSYSVVETDAPGFTTTLDGCTNVAVGAGAETTPVCTITNTRRTGVIRVKKVVVGSTTPATSFAFTVNGQTTAFESDGENTVQLPLGASYSVTEPGVSGFTTAYDNCTSLMPAVEGPGPLCTITNTASAPPTPETPTTPTPPVYPPAPGIDVAIAKTATSPTPLNGTVTYTLTVSNVGSTTATDVQVGDPAPEGITYTAAQPPAGVTCSVTPALVVCSRPGAFPAGTSFQIGVTGKATQPGTLYNTATVTAGGGSETNLTNNNATASTVVAAPVRPPTKPSKPAKPSKPSVKPARPALKCVAFTVDRKSITAQQPNKLRITISSNRKNASARIHILGPGIDKRVNATGNGLVVTRVRASKAGLVTLRLVKPNGCANRRVGVIGAFEPPLTG